MWAMRKEVVVTPSDVMLTDLGVLFLGACSLPICLLWMGYNILRIPLRALRALRRYPTLAERTYRGAK